MKGRNTQVSRILRIISFLETSRSGLTIREIHSRLENSGYRLSLRTVYRDINAIEMSGLPIWQESTSSYDGLIKWKLDQGPDVKNPTKLTEREILSLYMTKKAILPKLNGGLRESLINTLGLIEKALSPVEWQHYNDLDKYVHIGKDPLPQKTVSWEIVQTLLACCFEGEIAILSQGDPDGKITETEIIPSRILFEAGSIFVVSVSNLKHKYDLSSFVGCVMQVGE